jgi:tRNA/tmRNA/rRNA uracil-C5-methylase (TrmA/RlmC/RlmD family)
LFPFRVIFLIDIYLFVLLLFQVNTPATEVLYNRVISSIPTPAALPAALPADSSDSSTCVLDICCGTGTIGICALKSNASDHQKPLLLGIELCGPAVENARQNAKNNGILSFVDMAHGATGPYAEFVCSRAEDVLASLLQTAAGDGKGNRQDFEETKRRITTTLGGKKLVAIVDPPREVRTAI